MARSFIARTGIYCIRNLVSGRCYVGSAKRIDHRWKAHRHLLREGRHHSRSLQRSWNKHGEACFAFEVLEHILDLTQLIVREQFWIDRLHAADPKRGFNVSPTAGNCLGVKHSAETCAKRSAIMKGKPKSPEHRRAIGEAQKGKIIPEAQRAQLAEATRRHFAENPEARERMREVGRRNGKLTKGRVMSAEMRARNSEAQRRSEKARAAVLRNLRPPTREVIEKANAAAARALRGKPRAERRSLSYAQAEAARALKAWGATYDELETLFDADRANLFALIQRRTYQRPSEGEDPSPVLDLDAYISAIAEMRSKRKPPDCRNFGEKNGRAKINATQAEEIRALRQQGWSQQRIADQFGISQATVSNILLGRAWLSRAA